MIVVALTSIGVLSAVWSVPRLRRLAAVRLRHVELVWIAITSQIVLFEVVADALPMWSVELGHYATYAMCVAFIVINRRIPGAWLIALGTTSNLLAIVLNGGSMPANADAWRRAMAFSEAWNAACPRSPSSPTSNAMCTWRFRRIR